MRISEHQQKWILNTIRYRMQDNYYHAKTPTAHVSENTDLLRLWKEMNELGVEPRYTKELEQHLQTYTEPRKGFFK